MVHEYPDVFPDDLSVIPPDRVTEFNIELQSGTTPVYKRPYPMVPNELAELKTQLQEFLIRGTFDPVVHHGVVLLSLWQRTRPNICASISDHAMC
jgi:hypothetical protein